LILEFSPAEKVPLARVSELGNHQSRGRAAKKSNGTEPENLEKKRLHRVIGTTVSMYRQREWTGNAVAVFKKSHAKKSFFSTKIFLCELGKKSKVVRIFKG